MLRLTQALAESPESGYGEGGETPAKQSAKGLGKGLERLKRPTEKSRSCVVLVIPGRKCQDKSLEYCLVKSDVPMSKDSGMFD